MRNLGIGVRRRYGSQVQASYSGARERFPPASRIEKFLEVGVVVNHQPLQDQLIAQLVDGRGGRGRPDNSSQQRCCLCRRGASVALVLVVGVQPRRLAEILLMDTHQPPAARSSVVSGHHDRFKIAAADHACLRYPQARGFGPWPW